ncbi:SRPBCC family protein [Kitasatospora sp. NPDC048538]|uniref:SRPBCC family protein n=1 Tax=unclassified Kitasatospora TaxID=2633591 RepID=UPI0033C57B0C
MPTVERRITVHRRPADVLDYLADFGHTEQWDPGTLSCTRQDDGPIAVGSRWTNVSRFRGRATWLDYRLARRDPDRLVFIGHNATVTAIDDITVLPAGGSTVVHYRADLRLNGLARLAGPFLRPAFERLADEVALRLPQALAAGDPAAGDPVGR